MCNAKIPGIPSMQIQGLLLVLHAWNPLYCTLGIPGQSLGLHAKKPCLLKHGIPGFPRIEALDSHFGNPWLLCLGVLGV